MKCIEYRAYGGVGGNGHFGDFWPWWWIFMTLVPWICRLSREYAWLCEYARVCMLVTLVMANMNTGLCICVNMRLVAWIWNDYVRICAWWWWICVNMHLVMVNMREYVLGDVNMCEYALGGGEYAWTCAWWREYARICAWWRWICANMCLVTWICTWLCEYGWICAWWREYGSVRANMRANMRLVMGTCADMCVVTGWWWWICMNMCLVMVDMQEYYSYIIFQHIHHHQAHIHAYPPSPSRHQREYVLGVQRVFAHIPMRARLVPWICGNMRLQSVKSRWTLVTAVRPLPKVASRSNILISVWKSHIPRMYRDRFFRPSSSLEIRVLEYWVGDSEIIFYVECNEKKSHIRIRLFAALVSERANFWRQIPHFGP